MAGNQGNFEHRGTSVSIEFDASVALGCRGSFATSSAIAAADGSGRPARTRATTQALRLPENPQVFGTAMPSVVKATAIVNGDVITQTDVDQRLALLAIANGGKIPADQVEHFVNRCFVTSSTRLWRSRQPRLRRSRSSRRISTRRLRASRQCEANAGPAQRFPDLQ